MRHKFGYLPPEYNFLSIHILKCCIIFMTLKVINSLVKQEAKKNQPSPVHVFIDRFNGIQGSLFQIFGGGTFRNV